MDQSNRRKTMVGVMLSLLLVLGALGWHAPAAWAQNGVPASMELTLNATAFPLGANVTGNVKAKNAQGEYITHAYINGVSGATTPIRIKVQLDDAHSITVDAGNTFSISTSVAPALAAGNYTVTASHVEGGATMPNVTKPVALVEVEKILWRRPADAQYQEVSALGPVLKGTRLIFKAVKAPEDAAWPAGQPVWSEEAGGSGETTDVTFNTLSTSTNNYRRVKATCGTSSKSVDVLVYELTPETTPQDNFTGRSQTKFGVGEVVNLSYTTQPGGISVDLAWRLDSGNGAISGSTWRAGEFAITSVLKAEITAGPSTGKFSQTISRDVVAPTGAYMEKRPGTNLFHRSGSVSVGVRLDIYFLPKDISFDNIQFRETDGPAPVVEEGWFVTNFTATQRQHRASRDPITGDYIATDVGPGNINKGSQLEDFDTAWFRHATATPAEGRLLWDIPWEYRTLGNPIYTWREFDRAPQDMQVTTTGTASVEKQGAGPFTRELSDPDSDY